MGGHGGLNILPQKSWHVYNRENIERVERDKKKAEEDRKKLQQQREQGEADARLSQLKLKQSQQKMLITSKQQQIQDYNNENISVSESEEEEKQEQGKKSELAHLNLFGEEQRIIEEKEMIKSKIANKSYFEGKKIGPETALGQFTDEKYQQPWYLKNNKERILKKPISKPTQTQSKLAEQIRNFNSGKKVDNFYVKLDLEQNQDENLEQNLYNEIQQISESENSSDSESKDRKKKKKKKSKKDKKEKKKDKKLRKKEKREQEKIQKQQNLEKMRQERINREKKERQKELDIIRCSKFNN